MTTMIWLVKFGVVGLVCILGAMVGLYVLAAAAAFVVGFLTVNEHEDYF